jgi:hypothetical protein
MSKPEAESIVAPDSVENLLDTIDRFTRPVSHAEVDRALSAVPHVSVSEAAWVSDPLYVAKLVRHVIEERQGKL